ncbi:hypothetical protein BBF96_05085 [Anoxybacter fermentans]|uniref:Peptidase M50 domain-containing protein n=1 Tax=Anoxybacter fermentans TaxID=1323375 RepID=A0A3S9SWZ8_9FIRM|nr:M50 family metallopeptidase [Anoxybacter fermentans]AZR72821.1 hypothetical protein BBF96_05085 [Anoxybacter fermentans]
MKKEFIQWFLILLLTILISTFLHEVGHGVSAYLKGVPVSTGFNKVGNIYKSPGDEDFRSHDFKDSWDLGPIITWILAIIFTIALFKVNNKLPVVIIGSFAFTNSLLRLLPMINSYFSLLTSGRLAIEDEISMGLLWYEMSGITIMKYIPSLISILVSLICLHYVIKNLRKKIPALFQDKWSFTLISLTALIIAIPILNFLDQHVRINWG